LGCVINKARAHLCAGLSHAWPRHFDRHGSYGEKFIGRRACGRFLDANPRPIDVEFLGADLGKRCHRTLAVFHFTEGDPDLSVGLERNPAL
jgi:hypothetical protein